MPIDSSNVSHRFAPYSPNSLADKFDKSSIARKETICHNIAKEIEANQCITNKLLGRILTITGCPDIQKGEVGKSMYQGLKFNDGSFFAKKLCCSNDREYISRLYDPNGKRISE